MHINSYQQVLNFAMTFLKDKVTEPLKILDLGSFDINGNLREIFDVSPIWKYVGGDITEGKNVDIVLKDPYKWEFQDGEFDVVVSANTFEHIEYPWLTIKEVARVLKIGGLVCVVSPCLFFEHRFPIDCYRFYPDGWKALAKWGGLEVLETNITKYEFNEEFSYLYDSTLIARKP